MKKSIGRRWEKRMLALLLLLATLGRVCPAQQIPRGWKRFVSRTAGYVVYYPDSWHILLASLPTLYVTNFPQRRRVQAVILPEKGASIAVVPPPKHVATIEEWVKDDTERARQKSRSPLTIQRGASMAPIEVTEVISDWDDPGGESEDVACYFELSGHLLVARLIYWKGDADATKYRNILHRLVGSIGPIAP